MKIDLELYLARILFNSRNLLLPYIIQDKNLQHISEVVRVAARVPQTFKKSLIKNGNRRGQAAQRKPFQKRFERKPLLTA
jgi:hypothetical protein